MNAIDTKDLAKRFGDSATVNQPVTPSLRIDVEKYEHLLDDSDLSETQKREVLEALWAIIVAFVDLGFGVHPVQQACGEVEKGLDLSARTDSHEISSGNISKIEKTEDAIDRN